MTSFYKNFFDDNYLPLQELNNRLYSELNDDRVRNAYSRDYARLLYSNSFKRLQGKMQLFGITPDKFYRNRLTHSMEVAQISRSIASQLNRFLEQSILYQGEDMYVLETGSLAHDIGNPPFGHKGEKTLNELLKTEGGFEGNAQGIRIINKLEKKFPTIKGLNLTLRTQLSIVKYYKPYVQSLNSKFLYLEDFTELQNELQKYKIKPRTLDVQIIDLADEIAYCAHDLEDALSLSLFTIDELLFEIRLKDTDTYEIFKNWVDEARLYALGSINYSSSEEYAFIFRKQLTSIIVNNLIMDIDITDVTSNIKEKTNTVNTQELGFKKLKKISELLKEKTFTCVNRKPEIQLYEKMGEQVIRGLFECLTDEQFNKNSLLLPVEFRNSSAIPDKRLVADYISGMMDQYSINLYKKIYGNQSLNRFTQIDKT